MKYRSGDYEAIHQSPIWRDRADFVFAAHLGRKNGRNEWEQLWGQKTAVPLRFIVCCIPFFVRDVDLGDEVETDADYVLQRVVQRSGQFTFRVWSGGKDLSATQEIQEEIKELGPLMEWSSENLLALSARDTDQARKLADYLQAREGAGLLQYEAGHTK